MIRRNILFLQKIIAGEDVTMEGTASFREKINKSKNNHLRRFFQRVCATADGSIFNNILINLEEIYYHSNNIKKLLIE